MRWTVWKWTQAQLQNVTFKFSNSFSASFRAVCLYSILISFSRSPFLFSNISAAVTVGAAFFNLEISFSYFIFISSFCRSSSSRLFNSRELLKSVNSDLDLRRSASMSCSLSYFNFRISSLCCLLRRSISTSFSSTSVLCSKTIVKNRRCQTCVEDSTFQRVDKVVSS